MFYMSYSVSRQANYISIRYVVSLADLLRHVHVRQANRRVIMNPQEYTFLHKNIVFF